MVPNVVQCGLMWRIVVHILAPYCAKWRNVVLKNFFFQPHCATFRHILKYHFVVECGEMWLNVAKKKFFQVEPLVATCPLGAKCRFYDKWSISTAYPYMNNRVSWVSGTVVGCTTYTHTRNLTPEKIRVSKSKFRD